jgi:hypothetical protein
VREERAVWIRRKNYSNEYLGNGVDGKSRTHLVGDIIDREFIWDVVPSVTHGTNKVNLRYTVDSSPWGRMMLGRWK